MQTRIQSFYPLKSCYRKAHLFGYSSRGVPGLEIVGLGKIGRITREKFLYLTKKYNLQLPLKRFVICIEDDDTLKEAPIENIRWLELPLLILFWSLAGKISIHKLEDCFTAGKVSPCGKIEFFPFQGAHLEAIADEMSLDRDLKWIAPHSFNLPNSFLHLPLEPLFEGSIPIGLKD